MLAAFIAALLFFLLTPGLLIAGLRGGIQAIPINQSQSYYSDHNILNIASVNNAFNLYISVFENLKNFDHNPYLFMDAKSAEAYMKKIYPSMNLFGRNCVITKRLLYITSSK